MASEVLGSEEIYRGRVVNLRVDRVRLPSGVETRLERMAHPGASAVVAIDEEGQVVLIRQYRHAAGGYLWEIPAGTLHSGEDPDRCAARELVEEAGVAAAELVRLGSIVTTPGFCDEVIHVYLARGLELAPMNRDSDEVITEVRRVPLREALTMIERGEIRDAKSCYGLFRAAQWQASAAS